MQIGAFVQAASVPKETVRYYERRGLMPEPTRDASGYRHYGRADVARMRFIKEAQDLGFSLHEIDRLLTLREAPDADAAQVKRLAEHKLAEIGDKLCALRRQQRELERLAAACDGHGPTEECPILTGIQQAARPSPASTDGAEAEHRRL